MLIFFILYFEWFSVFFFYYVHFPFKYNFKFILYILICSNFHGVWFIFTNHIFHCDIPYTPCIFSNSFLYLSTWKFIESFPVLFVFPFVNRVRFVKLTLRNFNYEVHSFSVCTILSDGIDLGKYSPSLDTTVLAYILCRISWRRKKIVPCFFQTNQHYTV